MSEHLWVGLKSFIFFLFLIYKNAFFCVVPSRYPLLFSPFLSRRDFLCLVSAWCTGLPLSFCRWPLLSIFRLRPSSHRTREPRRAAEQAAKTTRSKAHAQIHQAARAPATKLAMLSESGWRPERVTRRGEERGADEAGSWRRAPPTPPSCFLVGAASLIGRFPVTFGWRN